MFFTRFHKLFTNAYKSLVYMTENFWWLLAVCCKKSLDYNLGFSVHTQYKFSDVLDLDQVVSAIFVDAGNSLLEGHVFGLFLAVGLFSVVAKRCPSHSSLGFHYRGTNNSAELLVCHCIGATQCNIPWNQEVYYALKMKELFFILLFFFSFVLSDNINHILSLFQECMFFFLPWC